VKLAKTRADSTNSWTVKVEELDKETFDLTVKNPNKQVETVQRSPKAIAEEMAKIDKENAALLADILKVLGK